MKRFMIALSVVASALIAGQAEARVFFYSGTVCQPAAPSDAASLAYTQFGVHNTGSAPVNVQCPLATSGFGTLGSVTSLAYDRSTSLAVVCDLQLSDGGGNVLFSTRALTSGSGTAVKTMSYSIPAGTSAGGYWRLSCTIPGVEAGQFSHLASINVSTSAPE